jgi:hypothetical protein
MLRSFAGWASITERVWGSDRNRNVIEPIEIGTLAQAHRRVQAADPALGLGPEQQSDFNTQIPTMSKSN